MTNAIDKALAAAGIDPAATAATMAAEHAAEQVRDAAPAMLAALEFVADMVARSPTPFPPGFGQAVHKVQAAIAAAKGESI